ncbi:radical SAM/CxCxxxxC motif protein YfkAB [Marinicrinis lubricantis]|uniref:Radical SAM/CxCxxxxC motif protein YfkAB n=1 Tax=Marinicrinis lubricantis TaxID=2086470 RepID=A0ABW1IJ54_9BACL
MSCDLSLLPVSPANDPWDPIYSLRKYGKHTLTSVEMTVTNLCNMRCEHCAVGDALVSIEGPKLPLELMLRRLDEIDTLETISITGGEPTFDMRNIKEYLLPLLQYARKRGIKSQLNSNLTLDYARYEMIAEYLDVMHISFNYTDFEDFAEVGFVKSERKPPKSRAEMMFNHMVENTKRLTSGGLFVSAESMINYRTHKKIDQIHELIVDMGCQRHEVHPMYPSSFAAHLPILSLQETREAIERLLDARNPEIWMLFGTLPFYHCNRDEEDQKLLKRLKREPNITVRNDPDGRNRLNVNLFTGDAYVTDFSDLSTLGNIHQDSLTAVFEKWRNHPLNGMISCHCDQVSCCGPNLLVMDTYYKDVDFTRREAIL